MVRTDHRCSIHAPSPLAQRDKCYTDYGIEDGDEKARTFCIQKPKIVHRRYGEDLDPMREKIKRVKERKRQNRP
jgi:hypothetical protein